MVLPMATEPLDPKDIVREGVLAMDELLLAVPPSERLDQDRVYEWLKSARLFLQVEALK